MENVALETAKSATEESTVVLRNQSEYGQTKSVKTRRPQRGRHRTGKERDR